MDSWRDRDSSLMQQIGAGGGLDGTWREEGVDGVESDG